MSNIRVNYIYYTANIWKNAPIIKPECAFKQPIWAYLSKYNLPQLQLFIRFPICQQREI